MSSQKNRYVRRSPGAIVPHPLAEVFGKGTVRPLSNFVGRAGRPRFNGFTVNDYKLFNRSLGSKRVQISLFPDAARM